MKYFLCIVLVALGLSLPAQNIFTGINYHPHDWPAEQWENDIKLMKEAGIKVARLAHLAWDSYEPRDGQFEFEWFDTVMDLMAEAGIDVILDIPLRPAPLWLHSKYPTMNIVEPDGSIQYPEDRYQVDQGDPNFVKYALRFADTLSKRYAKHPALVAFGIDNEPGYGPISYSETARLRFIGWAKNKYQKLELLNKAWATQRWSRRISEWDQIRLPSNVAETSGPPEKYLDYRRFVSDEILEYLNQTLEIVRKNAPDALTTSNFWPTYSDKGFDFAKMAYSNLTLSRNGMGFYPNPNLKGLSPDMHFYIALSNYETNTPYWLNEFFTINAAPGAMRKYAYSTLMMGVQLISGWTWRSMYAGEEQWLNGLIDHDGVPSRKYYEFKQIAEEFAKIEKYGFPYEVKPEVAIAHSFESQNASYYRYHYPVSQEAQMIEAFKPFFNRNIDVQVVDLRFSSLPQKLVIIPGLIVIDSTSAKNIRNYIYDGGTVIMTAFSGKANEYNQKYTSTHPGKLADVFGIRAGTVELTSAFQGLGTEELEGNKIKINLFSKDIDAESRRFEIIEIKGAKVLGNITSFDKDYPVVTEFRYGRGRAIYVGVPASEKIIEALLEEYIDKLGIQVGPEVPEDVIARQIDESHILYYNYSGKTKTIRIKGKAVSILNNKYFAGEFALKAYEPEFIEIIK